MVIVIVLIIITKQTHNTHNTHTNSNTNHNHTDNHNDAVRESLVPEHGFTISFHTRHYFSSAKRGCHSRTSTARASAAALIGCGADFHTTVGMGVANKALPCSG